MAEPGLTQEWNEAMANPQSLRTGAKIVERGGFPIAASQMRSAADEIDRLRAIMAELLPTLEEIEDKVLVGDEGCLWAIEKLRAEMPATQTES